MYVVNRKREPFNIYIGRGSKWGNPYKVQPFGPYTREEAISKYEEYIRNNKKLLHDLHELDGCVLGCYCKPLACHGDVLVKIRKEQLDELAEAQEPNE